MISGFINIYSGQSVLAHISKLFWWSLVQFGAGEDVTIAVSSAGD